MGWREGVGGVPVYEGWVIRVEFRHIEAGLYSVFRLEIPSFLCKCNPNIICLEVSEGIVGSAAHGYNLEMANKTVLK